VNRPNENGHRPAVDPLLRTAALVQDPADAMFPQMPQNALENVEVDFMGSPVALARELVRRTMALDSEEAGAEPDDECADELDAVEMDSGAPDPRGKRGDASPACGASGGPKPDAHRRAVSLAGARRGAARPHHPRRAAEW